MLATAAAKDEYRHGKAGDRYRVALYMRRSFRDSGGPGKSRQTIRIRTDPY